jgi:hypothetical protein
MIIDNITSSDYLRIGRFPLSLDIEVLPMGVTEGVMAILYSEHLESVEYFYQLLTKEHYTALVARSNSDTPLPEYWKDAEVLWDSRG